MIFRRRIAGTALLALVVSLAGCVRVRLESIVRADPARSEGYVQLGAEDAAGATQVFRGGQSVVVRPSMPLQPGDEIQTGPDVAAIITFVEQGTVVLAPHTRVRIGSLEVLFGRIFASVRGLFSAESDGVVAGVEGTEFMMELGADRTVRVLLVEGVVSCRSKAGSWAPVRVGATQTFFSSYPHQASPVVEPARPSDLAEISEWARRVRGAPRFGYCCDGGRVFQSIMSKCRGVFRGTAAEAEDACASGWCCASGRVFGASPDRCRSARGQFFPDREAAQRACAPTQDGWCCASGRVFATSQDRCRSARGQFFQDADGARQACTPSPEMGWCCYYPAGEGKGEVRYESRRQCGGKFFTDENTARSQCYLIR